MLRANRRTPLQILVALVALTALVTTTSTSATADPGPPGAPLNVTARAGDHLVQVSWDTPTPDDPTITRYTVTVSPPDAAPIDVNAATRTAQVTGLTNGTPYTVTVTATNAEGPGPLSEASRPPRRRRPPQPA